LLFQQEAAMPEPAVARRLSSMVKGIQLEDYAEIQNEEKLVRDMLKIGEASGAVFQIGHLHRFWEYGRALKMFRNHFNGETHGKTCLDIGGGHSPLGLCLALLGGMVTVTDPEMDFDFGRKVESMSHTAGKGLVNHVKISLEEIAPPFVYDAVFCVSVLEHLPKHEERWAWRKLAKLVKPGGFLYITVDLMPPGNVERGIRHTFDNLRTTNYNMALLVDRIEWLREAGLDVEDADTAYHGSFVHDYTFYNIIATKAPGIVTQQIGV
jgi:SAM-dependent methyltransferase